MKNEHVQEIASSGDGVDFWSDVKYYLKTKNEEYDFLISIQAHNRPENMKLLLTSIRDCYNSGKKLVIITLDAEMLEINTIISSMLIHMDIILAYMPYSRMEKKDKFPYSELNDCPPKISSYRAKMIRCFPAKHPDSFGNYRDPKYTFIKHHFWWKMNFIFDHLPIIQNLVLEKRRNILFLEEDFYLMPDALDLLLLLSELMNSNQSVDLIAVGNHMKHSNQLNSLILSNWVVTDLNIGFAFNYTMWKRLKDCAEYFCHFDDYNFDWTFNSLQLNCLRTNLNIFYPKISRVHHIGQVGLHSNEGKSLDVVRQEIEASLGTYSQNLFPKHINQLSITVTRKQILDNKWGGWGDPRDHSLCMKFTL